MKKIKNESPYEKKMKKQCLHAMLYTPSGAVEFERDIGLTINVKSTISPTGEVLSRTRLNWDETKALAHWLNALMKNRGWDV